MNIVKGYRSVQYSHLPLFKDVTPEQWNDWQWQVSHDIRDIETLDRIVDLTAEDRENLSRCLRKFRMSITPYYAALMDHAYRLCSVRLQAVPDIRELDDGAESHADPLHEDVDSPVPGLTHRYPDRVLFLVTRVCSMYCRHCTRRRMVGSTDGHMSKDDIANGIEYIRTHPEIRDVLISGGDPLILMDGQLEEILKSLRAIEHVEILRIGTRMPVVLPQRITEDLVAMLAKYHPLYVNTHFNHYHEITAESKEACERLANAGIAVGNQSVLLRDVNDCPRIMKKLVQELLKIRVKPYYIYQCDLSQGIEHFRTSIAKGVEIIEALRGHTTGMAVPTFVVDAPGGGGKIPVMPNCVVSMSDKRVALRNYEGVIASYTQPLHPYSECWCELCKSNTYEPQEGVATLLNGDAMCLEPRNMKRFSRRTHGH